VTTLTSLATEVRANRIVAGIRIPHPVSDPTVAPDREIAVRVAVAKRALEVLTLAVEGPTVFAVERVAAG
jgi:glycine reductase complex component B subunit gamma